VKFPRPTRQLRKSPSRHSCQLSPAADIAPRARGPRCASHAAATLAPSKGRPASSNRDTCTADHWLTAELLHNAGAISANELNTVIGRAAAIIDQPEVAGEPREDKQPNLGGRGVPRPTFELSLIRGAKLVAEFSKLARSPQNAPFAPLPFVLGGRWINKLIESLACQVGGLRSRRGTPRT